MQYQLAPFRDILQNFTMMALNTLVRLNVDCRIKPHAPPFIQTPANLFKFYLCSFTPQARYLRVNLHSNWINWWNIHRFRAWTTRVSNPDWYSCFNDLTSKKNEKLPRLSKILIVCLYFISKLYLSLISLFSKH